MRKKLWEMTLGILYLSIFVYQLASRDTIRLSFDFPVGTGIGCRVQAVIDLPGNRENPLDFTLRYDGGRLVYCKEAKGKGLKGLSVVSGLSETGEMLLEISALTGNRFGGRGKIILEFYVKKPCRDMYEYLKLCDEKMKKVKNPCCRIDNDFRKNYNDGNGFRKNKKADEN